MDWTTKFPRLAFVAFVLSATVSSAEPGLHLRPEQIVGRIADKGSVGKPGRRFRDCRDCPEMVVVPAGHFVMGSPADEPGRGSDEGPQQPVTVARPLAVGRFEITRDQYELFLRSSGHGFEGNCITDRRSAGNWVPDTATNLHDPGYKQSGTHPVVCVNWFDAKAYVDWLTQRTGHQYRLLSEAEWEYVARAGSDTVYPWGNQHEGGCRFANGADKTAAAKYAALAYVSEFGRCSDGALNTAVVGSYQPNAFGVYDTIGNVDEWTEDCSQKTYLPKGGSAAPVVGDCERRVVRGASWGTIARQWRSAERVNQIPEDRDDSIGIRVARVL